MHALAFAAFLTFAGQQTAPPAPTASSETANESDRGKVGVALMAGGAALATTTAAGVTLLQALTTPDDNRNKPQHPELTQVSGFVTVALGSVSAGIFLVGSALWLNDVVPRPAVSPSGPARD